MMEGIACHWDILRQSLRDARAGERERLLRRDTDFLPAALEIIETPPSPVGRMLLLLLSGLLLVALLWSIFAKIDIIVTASGRVSPLDSVKTISWGGSNGAVDGMVGVVREVRVKEGDAVRKGQLLIALDPTISGAESDQARRSLGSAQAEAARAQALSAYVATGRFAMPALPGLSAEDAAVQSRLVRATIAEYEAKSASIAQQRAEKQAQLASAISQRDMLGQTLALLDKEVAMRTELANKGYQSKVSVYQIQQMRIERQREIEQQESLGVQARASLSDLAEQQRQLREELTRGSLADLSRATDDASVRGRELAKAEHRGALMQIRAPVDGTIEQLRVRSSGGAIQAAQPLLDLVPRGGTLFVEAIVPNADIGFVRVGQDVQVKVDAFPFTDYGMLHGVVTSIGNDSINDPDSADRPAQPGPPLSGFKVRIRLKDSTLSMGDRTLRIGPGMRVQAEIRTGRRRIIQYLLSPLMSATSEAGRER
jgi:hemolysin D